MIAARGPAGFSLVMPASPVEHHIGPEGKLPLQGFPGKPGGSLLIVVPSVFGATPDLMALLADLSADGVHAWCFDPFWRVAPGPLPADRLRDALARARRTDHALVAKDRDVAQAFVQERYGSDSARGVMLGICFGGRFACQAALDGLVDAAVSWHGAGLGAVFAGAIEDSARLRGEHSLHFGDNDPLTPLDEIERLQRGLADCSAVDIAVYPGAVHGFTMRDRPAFDQTAFAGSLSALRSVLGLAF